MPPGCVVHAGGMPIVRGRAGLATPCSSARIRSAFPSRGRGAWRTSLPRPWRGGRTAIAPVLKTGARKGLWVRIPPPPVSFRRPRTLRGWDQRSSSHPLRRHSPGARSSPSRDFPAPWLSPAGGMAGQHPWGSVLDTRAAGAAAAEGLAASAVPRSSVLYTPPMDAPVQPAGAPRVQPERAPRVQPIRASPVQPDWPAPVQPAERLPCNRPTSRTLFRRPLLVPTVTMGSAPEPSSRSTTDLIFRGIRSLSRVMHIVRARNQGGMHGPPGSRSALSAARDARPARPQPFSEGSTKMVVKG